jgi:hypothetical protein
MMSPGQIGFLDEVQRTPIVYHIWLELFGYKQMELLHF